MSTLKDVFYRVITIVFSYLSRTKVPLSHIFEKRMSGLRKTVEENRYLSSHYHIFESKDYKAIIKLGRKEKTRTETVKLLFQDLLQESTWEVIYALGEILDYRPTPNEVEHSQGFVKMSLTNLTQGLISFGKEHGYI